MDDKLKSGLQTAVFERFRVARVEAGPMGGQFVVTEDDAIFVITQDGSFVTWGA